MHISESQAIAKRSYKVKFLEIEDSDDELQDNLEIESLLLELIPAYYTYRSHLINILKQSTGESASRLLYGTLPEPVALERINKCQQHKSARVEKSADEKEWKIRQRRLITQTIIEKNRKNLQQKRDLMKKYEMREVNEIIGNNFEDNDQDYANEEAHRVSNQTPIYNMAPQHHPPNGLPKRSSIDNRITNSHHRQGQKEPKQIQNKQRPAGNNSRFHSNVNQQQIAEQTEENSYPKMQEEESQKREIYGNQNKWNTSFNMNSQRQKTKQSKDSSSVNLPLIRINYHENENRSEDHSSEEELESSRIEPDGKKQNRKLGNMVKVDHEDTYSEDHRRQFIRHNTPNFDSQTQKPMSRNYFDLQRKKLEKQKLEAEKLHRQVSEVIGETDAYTLSLKQRNFHSTQKIRIEQSVVEEIKYENNSSQNSQQRFIIALRYMLNEVVHLWALSESYKYMLKNKQYEALTKLSRSKMNMNQIQIKAMQAGIKDFLKEQQKSQLDTIILKIFGKSKLISFEQFGQAISPNINEHQFQNLNIKIATPHKHDVVELTGRLFSVWLQIEYFELKIKKMLLENEKYSSVLESRLTSQQNSSLICLKKTEQFVFPQNITRADRLKVSIYFKHKFPRLLFSDLFQWAHNNNSHL